MKQGGLGSLGKEGGECAIEERVVGGRGGVRFAQCNVGMER